MKRFVPLSRARRGSIQFVLDWLPYALSFYAIPLAIALVSLTSLLLWDDVYSAHPEKTLELHVLAPSDSTLSLSEAQKQLPHAPATRYYNPQLSELPVWFSFSTPGTDGASKTVELPSRHAVNLACWDAKTLQPLGSSSSIDPDKGIFQVKAGFALRLARSGMDVICRTAFIGPARLSADLWDSQMLNVSTRDFQRKSGLLEGGMMVLTIFAVITALVNRNTLYIIFAAWLIVTLRITATSAGWDEQWLNHAIPAEWLSQGRSFTRAAWALLSVTLFKILFRKDIEGTRFAIPVTVTQWLSVGLLLAAAVLPRSIFLLTMWGVGSVALPLIAISLFSIIAKSKSRVALIYGVSLTVTLVSTLLEIVAAAFSIKGLDSSVYGVTVALASALLTALAIAEQMRQEHSQRLQAQAELEHTYEAMPIGLFTLDLNGHFMSANPALHKMLGQHVLRAGRNAWHQYFGNDAWSRLYQLVQSQNDGELELTGDGGDGNSRRFLVKATMARDKIEGSLQDVTEKSRATQELRFLANNDSLTKVLNRRGIELEFSAALAQLTDGKPMALAYLDLDRFKLINDLFGHTAGDEVLQQVCQRISGMLSSGIKMGRVGGDEFVIVFPDTKMPMATLICQGLVDKIGETPYRVGEKAFHVRGSIGLIEISHGTQMKDALSTADRACREAKTGQSKGLVVYERDSQAFRDHEAEIRLVEHLSTNEAVEGLFLEMQPIMSLIRPHDSLNFEVLLRMRDRDGALVPVGRLIAAGEHSGRMSVIDRWVLSTTLDWLDQHQDQLQRTKFVCINLSGASLNDEEFMLEVFSMLEENHHVVSYLSIEITENVALRDLENTRRFIDKVRSYGAKVALDDFGAGYTSFSYLKELPADLLKIDGSFIVNMNQHPANVAIVEAIVNLARNLGMKTIAEWAEDTATVQTLAEIGVDYVQGFAVARPQSPDKMLSAESSASFIQDGQLAQFAKLLGQADPSPFLLDLVGQEPVKKVH